VLKSAGAVFRDGLQFTLTTLKEKDATKRALFSFEPKHGWSFVAGPFDSTGTLHGTVEHPGILAVCRDRSAPQLGGFRSNGRALREHQMLAAVPDAARHPLQGLTLPRWSAVALSLKDTGAGLSEEGPVTLLDGRPWPARWDPEGERVVFEFWLDPGSGSHRLTVRAQDRVGNRSQREIRLDFGS